MSGANQTPLIDLLRSVPSNASMIYRHGEFHSQNIPVGSLCSQASERIAALEAQLAATQTDAHDRIAEMNTLCRALEVRLKAALEDARVASEELGYRLTERDEARVETQALRASFERECADGDKLCEALSVERTEGGSLNVPRMLSRLGRNRVYWMAEKNIEGKARWWMRPPRRHEHWDLPNRWTTDSSEAAHFSMKEAAEYVCENDMCECVVTEHMDIVAAIDAARKGEA